MRTLRQLILALVFIGIVPVVMAADNDIQDHPGYVDFTSLTAMVDTEPTVEVSLKAPLLNIVTKLIRNQDDEAAEFISKLRRVTVNVFETSAIDVDEISDSMNEIANELDDRGWERVIRVREDRNHVDIYFMLSDDAEIIYGITLMVSEPGDTVLVNIAGEISVDDISALGRRFEIDELVDIDIDVDQIDADQN